MEKKYIEFHKTTTADKRNPDMAYVRHNVYPSKSRGMYPSHKFEAITGVPASGHVIAHVGDQVFVQDGSDVKIYGYIAGATALTGPTYTITGVTFADAVDGNDGIHWITNLNAVYKNGTLLETLPGDGQKIIFDGLYYFVFGFEKVYRHLKSAASTEVFGNTGDTVVEAFADGNSIFWVTVDQLDFTITEWGKDNATLVERREIIRNAKFIAAGAVEGVALFVTSVGVAQNIKEKAGELVVSYFDGKKLVYINSVRVSESEIQRKTQAVGNGILLAGIYPDNQTHNGELFNQSIYKIKVDGSIETIFDSAIILTGDLKSLSVQYDYISIGTTGTGDFYTNTDNQTGYDGYSNFEDTMYITNLMDFTNTKHKFGGIGVTFEKLFDQTETLKISYRVSERDDWVEIDTITTSKVKDNMEARQSQTVKDAEEASDTVGLNVQMYEIAKMPDGTPFDEYYEIQFKLESNFGFSVIDFWYYTDAQKRITRR